MKKIVYGLLSLFFVTPCMANIHINPDAVVEVITEHFPNKKTECIREYNAQLKVSNGTGIAASKLWNVCAAGGLDIKQAADKEQCRQFVNALVKHATIKFYQVCGDDKGKTGATERCVTDFKNVKVNIGPAIAIAKEYAIIKYNDSSLQCSQKHRLSWNDDYIKCTSQNSNTFYEFQFDSVTESIDNTIQGGIQRAVCDIHNAPATIAGCAGGGTNVSAMMTSCWPASCSADTSKCAQINKSIAKFGYAATYKNDTCAISFDTVRDQTSLRTAFNIDNFVFCAGIQARNDQSIESYVKQYIADKAGVSVDNVKCDAGFRTYTGPGCKVNGITDFKDDIKTCHVSGHAIDLVFDDINENWTTYTNAANQAMACIVAGGVFTGKNCIGVKEQRCTDLIKENAVQCPKCSLIKWDPDNNICVLPNAVAATNTDKVINLATIGGVTIVGAVVTVATAGTGTVATAIVLAELTGGALAFNADLYAALSERGQKFLTASNQCNDASCAEQMIRDDMQALANMVNDLTDAEINAIDSELDRLLNLIPDDSELWDKTSLQMYELGLFDPKSWEPYQIVRAVGVAMQFTSLGAALFRKVTGFPKMMKTLKGKILSKADDAAALNKSRAALKEQVANGKKLENGTEKIPAGKMAAFSPQLEKFIDSYYDVQESFTRFINGEGMHQLQKTAGTFFDDAIWELGNLGRNIDDPLAWIRKFNNFYEDFGQSFKRFPNSLMEFNNTLKRMANQLDDLLDLAKQTHNPKLTDALKKLSDDLDNVIYRYNKMVDDIETFQRYNSRLSQYAEDMSYSSNIGQTLDEIQETGFFTKMSGTAQDVQEALKRYLFEIEELQEGFNSVRMTFPQTL